MTAFIGRREFITLLRSGGGVAARRAGAAAGDACGRISHRPVARSIRSGRVSAGIG